MLNFITKIEKKNITHNLTCSSKTIFLYPKNYNELKKILIHLTKIKEKALIKSGSCGHGDKSNLHESEFAISLLKLNKIIKFDKKNKTITAQTGISLFELFFYLRKRGYIIFNIPGGRSVTLGGGIAGNVHGRPSKINFENFGDNIISLKVMFENGKIRLITKKNKIFYDIVGGLGIYVVILEAKLKIHIITDPYLEKIVQIVRNKNEFNKYQKNLTTCYGYINYFNVINFEGSFFHFIPKKNIENGTIVDLKKYSLLNIFNLFRIPLFISFFINPHSLKIFYKLLFYCYKKFTFFSKKELFTLEKSMYFDLIQILPHFFRRGMIEIQFSVPTNNLFKLVSILKKDFIHSNIFPYYFLLKKMHASNKNYFFNFPKNNFCISLSFSKKDYDNNKFFFNNFYKLLFKKKCNLYVTKDETFIDNIDIKSKKKYFNSKMFLKNKILSSDFKEKILNLVK